MATRPTQEIVARLQPTQAFFSSHQHIFRSEAQLRYLANNRATNGLLESGAVYELGQNRYASKGQGGGVKLLWDPVRFADWILADADSGQRVA